MKICLVNKTSGWVNKTGEETLLKFTKILGSLSEEMFVITTLDKPMFNEDIQNINIKYHGKNNILFNILQHMIVDLSICFILVRISKKNDIIFFYTGGISLILPMLMSRLLRKKVVYILRAAIPINQKVVYKISILPYFLHEISKKIKCSVSNRIVIYSESLIKEWDLKKYKNKICSDAASFTDTNIFKINKELEVRENLVSYIGRLSEEKGVLNFVKAIPEILKGKNDIRVLIGGDGPLQGEIKKYLYEKKLDSKVELVGWIPHDELPDYLNELQLVVLLSYTEGLPNLMIEAMACGTPVLATPVGAIPDVIKDGETGFIMGNNSPECIAENVIRALECPYRAEMVENARELVERKFNYEAAVERYKKIVEEI